MRHSLSAVGPQASSRRHAAVVQDRKSTKQCGLGGWPEPHFILLTETTQSRSYLAQTRVRLNSLLKNSICDPVLKGRGF